MNHKIDLHCAVVGVSGSGKSYFMKKYFKSVQGGVLYFNSILDNKDWEGYLKVDIKTPFNEIFIGLSRGQKMVYSPRMGSRNAELEMLMKTIAFNKNVKVIFVLDEVKDLLRNEVIREDLIKLGEYGRHCNTKYVVASQRFQKIHKDVSTQCDDLIIFRTNLEESYMKREIGIDVNEFKQEVQEKKYHYAHIKNGFFKGIYKM